MGRRGLSAAIALSALLLLSAPPASAGGATWQIEPSVVSPGDEVFVWTAVAWAHNEALGTPEDGPWHAWMIPADSRLGPWGEIPDHAIHIGEIDVREEPFRNFGPNHARFTFTVPDVPGGRYEILHCNDPCTKQLGDITWGVFEVAGGEDEPLADAPVSPAPPTTTTTTTTTSTTTSTTVPATSTTAAVTSEVDGELLVATSPVDGGQDGIGWWLVAIAVLVAAPALLYLTSRLRQPRT